MERDWKRILIYLICSLIGIVLIILLITVNDNKVLISKEEYAELLKYKEIVGEVSAEDLSITKMNDLSDFEIIKMEISKQLQGRDKILYYKSFANEETESIIYYVVYYGIEKEYDKNKADIEDYINRLCLSVKKEWSLWGYPYMQVTICVESEEDSDFVYISSTNGRLDDLPYEEQFIY